METDEAKMKFKIVLEEEEEGYNVYVPTLPGCVSQGETREEAFANIREAISAYLESLRVRRVPLPRIEASELEV